MVVVAAATLLEMAAVRGKRHEATLSHITRCTFRTETPCGRAAFAISWTALWAWYYRHILKEEIRVQETP